MTNQSNTINTSRNWIPKVINKYKAQIKTKQWINFGCGAYPERLEGLNGVQYDPFMPEEKQALSEAYTNDLRTAIKMTKGKSLYNKVDLVICANVLNVLTNDNLDNVISQLISIDADHYVISIYERNKDGVQTPTRDGYQRNEKTEAYITKLNNEKLYGYIVEKRHGFIHMHKIGKQHV